MEIEKTNKEDLTATLTISQKAGATADGGDHLSILVSFDPSAKELGLTKDDDLPPSYQLMGEVYVYLLDFIKEKQSEGVAEVTESWGLEDKPRSKLN